MEISPPSYRPTIAFRSPSIKIYNIFGFLSNGENELSSLLD
jgi:hypothetical protein